MESKKNVSKWSIAQRMSVFENLCVRIAEDLDERYPASECYVHQEPSLFNGESIISWGVSVCLQVPTDEGIDNRYVTYRAIGFNPHMEKFIAPIFFFGIAVLIASGYWGITFAI